MRRQRNIAALAAGAVAFAVYWYTLAPTVTFIDAGELAAVAHTLGIAHPTGYPLYTMLAWAWQLLPIGSVMYRLNLLSALFTAVSVVFYANALWIILGRIEAAVDSRTGKPASGASPGGGVSLRAITVFLGGLTLAFSRTLWSNALGVEVHPLHALFISLLLWLFLSHAFGELGERKGTRRWLLFAFVLGLSFTNHGTTIMLAPAVLYLFFRKTGFTKTALTRIVQAVPLFLLGLLPLAYIPVRAMAKPALNWNDPSAWTPFVDHVTGKQFRAWMFSGLDVPAIQLKHFVISLPGEFGYAIVLLVAAGIIAAYRLHRETFWFTLLLFLGALAYAVNYAIYDIDAYFVLAYLAASAWAAVGMFVLLRRLDGTHLAFGGLGIVALLGAQFTVSYLGASERDNFMAEDYTRNAFETMERNAVVFSNEWNIFVSPALYFQHVEGYRTDVAVVDRSLLKRPWYIAQVRRNHPDLMRGSEAAIESYLDEYRKFERGERYDYAVIRRRLLDLMRSIMRNNYASRPLYVDLSIGRNDFPEFSLVPQGLAFRLYRPGDEPPIDAPVRGRFMYRSARLKDEIRASIEMRYFDMNAQRGYYLYRNGRKKEADTCFARAAEFRQMEFSDRWKRWRELYGTFYTKL